MNKVLKNILTYTFILCGNIAYSQIKRDTIPVVEYIYNNTYKNIAAYYIKYSKHDKLSRLDKNKQLNTENGFFFDKFLPDYGYKLKMNINKLSLKYPINDYELYEIFIDKLSFINESKTIEKMQISTDTKGMPFYSYYLLAINNKNRYIKFISGEFFISPISKDFSLDSENPNSFLEYIKLKLFYLQTKNIEFVNRKGKRLYFKAYSEEFKKQIIISLSLNDIENSFTISDIQETTNKVK